MHSQTKNLGINVVVKHLSCASTVNMSMLNDDNNQHIFDFMKVNKAMKKSLIMEQNYLEILPEIFGEWGNCIKDPREGWSYFGGRTLANF